MANHVRGRRNNQYFRQEAKKNYLELDKFAVRLSITRPRYWQGDSSRLRLSVTPADWEAAVILEKSFGNICTVRPRNIGKNGRIVIHKDGNGIFIPCVLHYNDTYQTNNLFIGWRVRDDEVKYS